MPRPITSNILKVAVYLGLVAGGSGTVLYYRHTHSADFKIAQLEAEKQQLQEQKQQLETVVKRLNVENRVAEILVRDQKQVGGVTTTTLLFVEYARDGVTPLPPKVFSIDGNTAHIDAMVIKFDHDFIEQNDPLRGHSIALFRKLYGERQTPDNGFPIDAPGKIPDIYRGPSESAKQSEFEQELWQNFWRLADDKEYRKSKGVRVADGEGVWGPFAADKLYKLTLDANGGLNLTNEPLKGIYLEALKHAATQKAGE